VEQHRLFVAIELPVATKTALFRLKVPKGACRPVSTAQLHLTLRFIDAADDITLHAIKAALADVSGAPFSLQLREVGCFPPEDRPRVLWVGVSRSPELQQLQHRVELAVRTAGVPAESRRFSPHITIARTKEPAKAIISAFLSTHRNFATPNFTVTGFNLYTSKLSASGAEHTLLQKYPLQLGQR
jgi:2'-5' RNA ligase